MQSSSSSNKDFADALAVARVIGNSPCSSFAPGAIINGSYEVQRLLANGSMGTVYLCRHTKLANRIIAVKILSAEVAADDTMRRRFADEICNTYDVSHPNVIRTYEYFEDGTSCGFSMEYADGGDLLSLVEKHGPLPFNLAINLLKQMCSGVAAIHQSGIVHRDIKPENMLLTRERQIKVSDFGIAYSKARSRKVLTSNVEGAIDYLSPEYVENGTFDERSDIFALGMVAFRLIAGRTPTESSDVFEALQLRVQQDLPAVSAYRPDCPVFLVEFIRKCLQRDPNQRFQHVSEMLVALNGATTSTKAAQTTVKQPQASHNPTPSVPQRRPASANVSTEAPNLFSRLIVTVAVAAGMLRIAYLDASYPTYLPQMIGWVTSAPLYVEEATPIAEEVAPIKQFSHTVSSRGETLALIALWYTGQIENWRVLADANPSLDADRIELGQEIFIPEALLKQRKPLGEEELEELILLVKERKKTNTLGQK